MSAAKIRFKPQMHQNSKLFFLPVYQSEMKGQNLAYNGLKNTVVFKNTKSCSNCVIENNSKSDPINNIITFIIRYKSIRNALDNLNCYDFL
jgi:hypothetical protein